MTRSRYGADIFLQVCEHSWKLHIASLTKPPERLMRLARADPDVSSQWQDHIHHHDRDCIVELRDFKIEPTNSTEINIVYEQAQTA